MNPNIVDFFSGAPALQDKNGYELVKFFFLLTIAAAIPAIISGGIAEAPVDGEGQPTREVVLVDEGGYRQPLLAWWQSAAAPKRASGCVLRPGWRDRHRRRGPGEDLRAAGGAAPFLRAWAFQGEIMG